MTQSYRQWRWGWVLLCVYMLRSLLNAYLSLFWMSIKVSFEWVFRSLLKKYHDCILPAATFIKFHIQIVRIWALHAKNSEKCFEIQRIWLHKYTCTYINVLNIYIYICVHIYLWICAFKCACMWEYMHTYVQLCVYKNMMYTTRCIHVCMFNYIYIHSYIHMHTYVYTYIYIYISIYV